MSGAAWTPSLDQFHAFAALSGDDNPIHLDPGFAARHPFGAPVSHGMLIHLQLWALFGDAASVAVTFPRPAFADQPLLLSAGPGGQVLARRAADGLAVYEGIWTPAPLAGAGAAPQAAGDGDARRAQLCRAFGPEDLAMVHQLTGRAVTVVPQPLVGALLSCLLGTRLPGPGTGWLKQQLTHHAAPALHEPLTATVTWLGRRPGKPLADLGCLCTGAGGRLIATGRALMLLPA